MRVARSSFATGKPVALGLPIEFEFRLNLLIHTAKVNTSYLERTYKGLNAMTFVFYETEVLNHVAFGNDLN